ncbi:hypothetical protein LTR66_000369 [Elasticomyces elasticus]|nr:hypothetical protein LTR66_000369 [Elasticomyces elasticus]
MQQHPRYATESKELDAAKNGRYEWWEDMGALQAMGSRLRTRGNIKQAPYLDPEMPLPLKRRRASTAASALTFVTRSTVFLGLLFALFFAHAEAVFIRFENCLSPTIVNSSPTLQLQFIPYFFDARFNARDPSHNLNITIYGNVSGQATQGILPSGNDTAYWRNPNETFGKIVDISPSNNKYTTLFQRYQVLTYDAFNAPPHEFCQSTVNHSCPLVPSFFGNVSDPRSLSAFTVAHEFYSSYAFATLAATIRVQSGDKGAPDLACVSANITPDLGKTLSGVFTYLPAAILALVAIATASAAIYSPWGSSDPFRWTSNYGRDEDLLRLVTPGFGDCLQYIQFVVLSGSLTLNYPGYYQPAVSQTSWAALMFNESFVSHGNGTKSLIDGIYAVNETYGMTRMSQFVGMTAVKDIWACMAIWLLVIAVVIVTLCQLGFITRWGYRQLSGTTEEDLRRKNWPFTAGNIVRVVFNYFLLPIVSLSMFQLVVAPRSPVVVIVMGVILLLAVIVFAGWILWLIFATKPRAYLFDDLPTVLLYGPLYNTYSDESAPFALIPAFLTFMRGVAIGAVQPSGIAQIIILAICEVILILTLNAFRPFHSPTSMNAYHTFFAAVRLIAILLSVAFVPSLGVTEAPKGWLGYAILLLHAIVLIFGFFLNAVQTLVEVCARMAGVGGDAQHGATRGGLVKAFGVRQLSKRQRRRNPARDSMTSDAVILAQDSDAKSVQLMGGRSRSLSVSSQIMLNKHLTASDNRFSGFNFDQFSSGGDPVTSPAAEDAQNPFSYLPGSSNTGAEAPSRRSIIGARIEPPIADPYYRPPRQRKPTSDPYTPGSKSRGSFTSGEWNARIHDESADQGIDAKDSGEGPSTFSPERATPSPAYLRREKDGSESDLHNPSHRSPTDYAVREVDFYYGVRGPALSNVPGRKLKTGPADPVGPVSSATGWFKGIFGGKSKEKGKGFEVVRSSRAPLHMIPLEDGTELQTTPPMNHEPYHDSPDRQPASPYYNAGRVALGQTDGANDEPNTVAGAPGGRTSDRASTQGSRSDYDHPSPSNSDDGRFSYDNYGNDPFNLRVDRVSDVPPMLAPIEMSGGIDIPSRIGSRTSSYGLPSRNTSKQGNSYVSPGIPRKSSRRTPSQDKISMTDGQALSTVGSSRDHSRVSSPGIPQTYLEPNLRLPFGVEEEDASAGDQRSEESSRQPSREELRAHSGDFGGPTALFGHRRNQGSLSAPQNVERPTSVGFVSQRLASDSVTEGSGVTIGHGSRAEVVNGRRSYGSLKGV